MNAALSHANDSPIYTATNIGFGLAFIMLIDEKHKGMAQAIGLKPELGRSSRAASSDHHPGTLLRACGARLTMEQQTAQYIYRRNRDKDALKPACAPDSGIV